MPEHTRGDLIAGLHALADFLDTHPGIEVPKLAQVVAYDLAGVVGFLDGLDEVTVAKVHDSGSTAYVTLTREFGGLTLSLFCAAELVGTVAEVPSTKFEFTPSTPEQIRAAVAVPA